MDAIDSNIILKRKLRNGDEMPAVGMGTFGSDRFGAEEVAGAVLGAGRFGYRLFDCASVYGNENLIGSVFKQFMSEGIRREEMFIMSKVWNDAHKPADVRKSIKQTLKDLNLDYLDMYFIHWPFRNFHAPGCSVASRNPDSHRYIHEEFMETWHTLETLQKDGYTRHLGTSNSTVAKLELLLKDACVLPSANEMELHPCFQQQELFDYCIQKSIQPVGFCPIGSPTRPDRDKTSEDDVDIQDPNVVELAQKYGVHPAIICLKWAVKRGQIPIPFSVKPHEYQSNLMVAAGDFLTDSELKLLEGSDKKCRLIKGQVFLWEGEDDWRALWDEDGKIKGGAR